MTISLSERVAKFCHQNKLLAPNDKIVVGVSGGPDSICLLHILTNLVSDFQLNLVVAHLNHQLRDEATIDEDYVRRVAVGWHLPFYSETQDVVQAARQRGESLEEAARRVRYNFLWRVAAQVGANKIAVGHNADDQAETVLMHFLRGSGTAGLRGMVPAITLTDLALDVDIHPANSPDPRLIRPLLETSRSEIDAYCQQHNLSPRQDSTNLDTTFFRNRLRHHLLPVLETYNPNIHRALQRTARVIAAEVEFQQQHLAEIWPRVTRQTSPGRIEFDLNKWLDLPLAMKRSTLRQAVHLLRRSLRDIGFDHIDQALTLLEHSATGKKVTLPQNLMLVIGYDIFYLIDEKISLHSALSDRPYLAPEEILAVSLPGSTAIPQSQWQLRATILSVSALKDIQLDQVAVWEAYLDADAAGEQLFLRTRQPGDKFSPLGMIGKSQKLGDFMTNTKIPLDQRDDLPLLIRRDETILWVCGYRLADQAAIRANTQRVIHLKFEPQFNQKSLPDDLD